MITKIPIGQRLPPCDMMVQYSVDGHFLGVVPREYEDEVPNIEGVFKYWPGSVTRGLGKLAYIQITQEALQILGETMEICLIELSPEAMEIMRIGWVRSKEENDDEWLFSRKWFNE